MSKAYVQLSESDISESAIFANNNGPDNQQRSKYNTFLIILIVVMLILITISWFNQIDNNKEVESFSQNSISDSFPNSFPASIDSNTTMSSSGKCHRSILKNRGYLRPYSQTPTEKQKEKKKVRWSDTLVMIAED